MMNTVVRRMPWSRWMLMIAACALLFTGLAGSVAFAHPAPPVYQVSMTDQNINLASAVQELTPENSSYVFYLDVPTGIQLNSAVVHVFFRYSSVLIGSESSLMLAIDGTPVAMRQLYPQNSGDASISLAVPSHDLSSGYHEVSVTAQLRSQRNVCADYDSQENWLVILPSSYIHFSPANSGALPALDRFPFPFAQPFQPTPGEHTTIIVPSKAANDTLTAVFIAVDSVARHETSAASVEDQVTPVTPGTVPPIRGAAIYVAPWHQVPIAWQHALRVSWKGHANEGLLAEIRVDAKSSAMVLIVTGQSGSGLIRAANALEQSALMNELPGTTAWISPRMLRAASGQNANPPVAGSTPLQQVVTLSQLGYGPTLMAGKEEEVAVYSYTTPLTWRYGANAGFHLILTHSSLLASSSAVTVSVNNQPMVSHPLTVATASGLRLFVPLPKGIHPGQTVAVTVDAEMFLSHPTCAGVPNDLRPFVSISPSSWFNLPHVLQPSLALEDFPSLFVTDDDHLRTVTAVLPAEPTSTDLTALARVIAGYADTYSGTVRVQTEGAGALARGDVWLIGVSARAMPVGLTRNHLESRRLPVSSEAATDGAVVEQAYRPDRPGAIWLIQATSSARLLNAATWFGAHRPAYEADGSVLLRVQNTQNTELTAVSAPFESWIVKLDQSLEQAYLFLFEQSGQTLIYVIAFAASLGSVLSYLLWSLFRRRPDLRDRVLRRKSR